MKINFNSSQIDVRDNITVSQLRDELSVPEAGVAVAVNGDIVVASKQADFVLKEGDDVILIGAAYGG